jgi:hypothetical protein
MTDQTEQQATPEYSVTELDNAVAAGQITQTQRDQIFATQIERKAMAQATQAATQIIESTTRENTLDTQLQQYASIAPDVTRDGSPLRQRVAQEFEFLVQNGAPRDLTTELAAVRAVMGPLERAKQYAQGSRRGPEFGRDSYGGSMSPIERRAADAFDRLDPMKQQYYQKLINQGLYPDKKAVISELNWKRGSNNKGRA